MYRSKTSIIAGLGIISCVALASCVSNQDNGPTGPSGNGTGEPGNGQGPSADPVSFTVSLQRTACFGACPMYVVSADDTGRVVFEGERFVAETGTHEYQLSPESVAELRAAIEAADFFSLEDCYCERKVTDMPGVNVTLSWDGREKTVRHYTGDESAPERLVTLQQAIDSIIGTQRWISEPASGEPTTGEPTTGEPPTGQ